MYRELDEELSAGKVIMEPDLKIFPDFESIREYWTLPFVDWRTFNPLSDNVSFDVNDILDFRIKLVLRKTWS